MTSDNTLQNNALDSSTFSYNSDKTVAAALRESILTTAGYTGGDQVAPCAILWTDPDGLWASAIAILRKNIPSLFTYGAYKPEVRTGPAIWLRCMEARVLPDPVVEKDILVFYLPGVSRQQLREIEECPPELHPLTELQFRGAIWHHVNGKDWTPYAFLVSVHGGLGLDVARDGATQEAIQLSLQQVLDLKVADLRGKRLDADYFNRLLAPDLPSLILFWMNEPEQARASKSKETWRAFCKQCRSGYGLHPEKEGPLHAAELMGKMEGPWESVWIRFREAPQRYGGVINLLEKIDPRPRGIIVFNPEPWPTINDEDEKQVAAELHDIGDKPPGEASNVVRMLEQDHGGRRRWIWRELGRSQFALALEHLAYMADRADKPIAGLSIQEMAEHYTREGWLVDWAALSALACCTRLDHEAPICRAVRSLYLPWLDTSNRNLQNLVKTDIDSIKPATKSIEVKTGRIILFVDGLRYDIARQMAAVLMGRGVSVTTDWDWAPYPGVTATAKPFASPVADSIDGTNHGQDFSLISKETGKVLTHERFRNLLKDAGLQVLEGLSTGDTSGCAWAEMGAIDRQGHNEGWKLAKRIHQNVDDVVVRIQGLLEAGWKEILIVTDHGWILMPRGFPKVELPKFLAESRWGRCASMKETAAINMPVLPWHWNPAVSVASPHGVACFRAGLEFDHGGISLQEMIVPRMLVRRDEKDSRRSRIGSYKWVGMRCRIIIETPVEDLRADLRLRPLDPETSIIEKKTPRGISEDGTVSLPVPDVENEGIKVVIVLLDGQDTIIDQLATTVGDST